MSNQVFTHKDKISDLNDEVKRTGDHFTKKVTKAMKKESWKLNFFELVWMAVVSVCIGLYVAYNIGFGKSPDNNLFLYFGIYTAFTVVMTALMRMFKTTAEKEAEQKTQRSLLRCNNHIFHLITKSRNCFMDDMDETQRRIYAATIILQNPESSSSELEVAVQDLTDSTALAQAVCRIESFRHHGMMARIADEYNNIADLVEQHFNQLYEVYPTAAQIFMDRMKGYAPNMQDGLSRNPGFLERTLNAIEHNDLNIVTFEDVSAVFSFTFEMLNGREIPVLHPEFKGHEDYMVAQDKLDRSRSYLKQSIAKRNSRLKALAELLSSELETEIVIPAMFSSDELVEVIENLYKEYRKAINNAIKDKNKKELRRLKKVLTSSFKFQEKVNRHQRRAERYLAAFKSIQKSYNKQWRKHGKSIELILGDEKGSSKDSISIREDYITLDDMEKVTLANKLITLHRHTLKEQKIKHKKFIQIELSPNAYKRLAMEYVLILDEMLHFSQPEEMFAIEFSNMPCLSHIDINSPSRTKVGLAILSIEELQQTRKKVAHRLAYNLREYYKVALNQSTIDYFVRQYGAEREYLMNVNQSKLSEKQTVEERYNINIKMKDWEKRFTPTFKRMRLVLSK
ncbi:MAG: hypothetical protein CMF60_03055 [Magnetococcales bacterium]|nr:hypothetical protein [Magnetococcales bacterium]MEC8066970.1 hypothetical protein [Pseudomonadota bacterium]|tara:strand:+ start:15242 stop:17113 length:1872 start_codon:yes stop_codon:yes gene_type:complete